MKKIIAMLLVLAMALTLVACGAKEEKPAETQAAAQAPAETQAAPAEAKEITYWSMWNAEEPQGQVIQEAAAAYEAKTGVKVNIEWKGRDIQTVIAAALEAGENIDLFDDDYQRIAASYVNYTADLTDMAAAAGYKGYDCFNNFVINKAGFLNSIVEQPQVGGVFYIKDAFEKAGVAEPTTWEEFLAVSEKLVAAEIAPLALDAAYTNFTYYYHLVRHLGEDGVAELSANGGWAQNEKAVAAAQEIVDYVKAGYMADGAPDEYPSGQNKLGTGEAAMVVCANYVTSEINGVFGEQNWGLFNYPTVAGSTNTAAYAGANSLAVTSYSENKQEAFDFIMFLTTGEFDQKMADTAGQIPCDPSNTAPAALTGTIETLLAAEAPMTWCDSIRVKEDLMPSFKTLTAELYGGKFESGLAFCEAMDALY